MATRVFFSSLSKFILNLNTFHMDINKDTGEGSKEINVMVQYSRTGPWEPVKLIINPQAFLDAKSKDVYIRDLVESASLGMSIVSLSFNYTEDHAKEDLKLE